jgi:phospholipase C
MSQNRRDFLFSTATAAGTLWLSACTDAVDRVVAPTRAAFERVGARHALSRVDHVILVMMENRSFDHFLGWHPRADGRQAGLVYVDRNGNAQRTHALAPDFQGCGHSDPDHSFDGARVEYDSGACDGWLRAGSNDRYAIGYYRQHDLPFLGQASVDWTTFDRYFAAILGPTFPNRFYQHAAQTDRLSNTLMISTLPTIWDRLFDAGLKGRYYFSDLPFVALWGAKYLAGPRAVATPIRQFFADCAAGTLPEVSFVDPAFLGEADGTGSDDHPFGDIRAGESFLNKIYQAVTRSPSFDSTLLILTFDEWGGFFDHVPPPAGAVTDAERALGYTDGLRGFRIPVVLISPFARRRTVAHEVFDHTSILKLIETRWDLEPLSVRDAAARNLGVVLDGSEADDDEAVPQYAVPDVPAGAVCPTPPLAAAAHITPSSRSHWHGLRDLARAHGWRG